jgi:hypothetical protein
MKLKKALRCEYRLCLVACLVPSVMEVRKVRISSDEMESNCLSPKSLLNLERVILYEFMVFFLGSSSGTLETA